MAIKPLETSLSNYTNPLEVLSINKEASKGLTIRIAIFGEQKCGKSSLINCYLKKSFSLEKEDTILDMYAKKIKVYGFDVTLVISEISDEPQDTSLLKQITNESHMIFLCFSLEDETGKLNEAIIDENLSILKKVNCNLPIFIVGCKLDLLKDELIDVVKICDDNESFTPFGRSIKDYITSKRKIWNNNICGYYITSSLLNINVKKLFEDAIRTVCYPFALEKMEKHKEKEKNLKSRKKKGPEEIDTLVVREDGCIIF